MHAQDTAIPDVKLLIPKVFADDRGFFFESYNEKVIESLLGRPAHFVQDNHTRSSKGVLRGLHYQMKHTQGKLVRCVVGEIFDVAVDIRRSSKTFGQWVGVTLSAENKNILWIPEGFAHGFVVLSDWAEVLYKTTDIYDPTSDRSIVWNAPEIAISWPITAPPILSPKDAAGKTLTLAEAFP